MKADEFNGPRLTQSVKLTQKQILTPGLVQMVTVLQLNRLELKEMITQEIVENPALEEATEEPGEEITPEELLPLLEAEPVVNAADQELLDAAGLNGANAVDGVSGDVAINGILFPDAEEVAQRLPPSKEAAPTDSACGTPGCRRSFRRNRFRPLFRRLPRPRLQELRRRNRSKNRPSKPSFPRPLRWAIICARN